ncbi:MAG: class I SAM-dependent methyltransferase [Desulfosarcina sp.]|nr:class I SAM-dependent methyltransferase [Desulfobacterales bacterium]
MKSDPYRWLSKVYDPLVEPFNATLRNIGFNMVPLEKGMRVLEVGCGTGTNLQMYHQAGCDVFGIDPSPAMLRVAHRKLGPEAHLHQGDAARMPYPDDTFDLGLAMLTLHEMPRSTRLRVIGEFLRVVKREGRLLLIDFHPGPLKFPGGYGNKLFILLIERIAGREHFRNHCDFIARGGLLPFIERSYLTIEKRKIISGGNLALFAVKSR